MEKLIKRYKLIIKLLEAFEYFEEKESRLLRDAEESAAVRFFPQFKKDYIHDADIAGRAKNRMLETYKKIKI
jgi:hypothetical protein